MVSVVEYLGQLISFKNRVNRELAYRIKKVWANFWGLKSIKGRLEMGLKISVSWLHYIKYYIRSLNMVPPKKTIRKTEIDAKENEKSNS